MAVEPVALLATAGTCRSYRLDFPWPRPPLTANQRLHYMARSQKTRMVRETTMLLARAAQIPAGRHITVCLYWAPGDRRRRDADNLVPTLKACADALARGRRRDWVGLELVPDDTPAYMEKLMPVIVPPPAVPGLWLEVQVTP